MAKGAPSVVDRLKGSPVGRLARKYGEDQASNLAAILAYNALFSMFPILLSLLTILGFFMRDPSLLDKIQSALFAVFPNDPDVANSIREALTGTSHSAGLLAVVSFLGLLWGGSSLFGSMEMAFNTVYGVKQRSFIMARLLAFVMIFVFASLLLATILSSSVTTLLAQYSNQLFGALGLPLPGAFSFILGWVVSLLTGFVMFLALFWIVPNRRFRFRHVFPGAALATVLFVGFTILFPLYSKAFGSFNKYGASFGLAFLLLTWFSWLGQILLIGTELNCVLMPDEERQPVPVPGTRPLREATVERPTRVVAARRAALTPAPHAAGAAGGTAPLPPRWLPLGVVGAMTGLWLVLGRKRS